LTGDCVSGTGRQGTKNKRCCIEICGWSVSCNTVHCFFQFHVSRVYTLASFFSDMFNVLISLKLLVTCGIIVWRNSSYSNKVFKLQKRIVGIIQVQWVEIHVVNYLKILIFSHSSMSYFALLCFFHANEYQYIFNSGMHGRNTRQNANFRQPILNIIVSKTDFQYGY
jgi:hypothetical protein